MLFCDVLNRKNSKAPSLRAMDWCVTNYAKKNNISVRCTSGNKLNVYTAYKNQLRAYSKRLMDPFARRTRITFEKFGKELTTTIGQLNFFKWAISCNIVDYCRRHLKEIEADMLKVIKNPRIVKSTNNHNNDKAGKKGSIHCPTGNTLLIKRKSTKRGQLSIAASKAYTCTIDKVIICFD